MLYTFDCVSFSRQPTQVFAVEARAVTEKSTVKTGIRTYHLHTHTEVTQKREPHTEQATIVCKYMQGTRYAPSSACLHASSMSSSVLDRSCSVPSPVARAASAGAASTSASSESLACLATARAELASDLPPFDSMLASLLAGTLAGLEWPLGERMSRPECLRISL